MELKITNSSSRLIIERTDNGVVLYETSEENAVSSKFVYEAYRRDGILNFQSIIHLLSDVLELMKIPSEDTNSNSKMTIVISKIDPDKNEEDE